MAVNYFFIVLHFNFYKKEEIAWKKCKVFFQNSLFALESRLEASLAIGPQRYWVVLRRFEIQIKSFLAEIT